MTDRARHHEPGHTTAVSGRARGGAGPECAGPECAGPAAAARGPSLGPPSSTPTDPGARVAPAAWGPRSPRSLGPAPPPRRDRSYSAPRSVHFRPEIGRIPCRDRFTSGPRSVRSTRSSGAARPSALTHSFRAGVQRRAVLMLIEVPEASGAAAPLADVLRDPAVTRLASVFVRVLAASMSARMTLTARIPETRAENRVIARISPTRAAPRVSNVILTDIRSQGFVSRAPSCFASDRAGKTPAPTTSSPCSPTARRSAGSRLSRIVTVPAACRPPRRRSPISSRK